MWYSKRTSAAALIFMAACGQSTPAPEQPAETQLTTPSDVVPDTTLSDADARRAALPSCGDAGGGTNCLLTERDSTGAPSMQFEVRYAAKVSNDDDPYNDTHPITIGLTTPDGTVQQLISETQLVSFMPVSLQDLNADGISELLVPLETGNVNTIFAIYHSQDGTAPYTRLGEAHTVGFDVVEGGLFAAPARSSAAEWETAFYKIQDGALVSIATAMTLLAPDGSVESCDIRDDGGLEATGLNTTQALALMCSGD